jgi:S1-C subfamily serine protease
MDAWIEVREGGRAGSVHRLSGEPAVVGRHGEAHLRLDPTGDLAVSGRHAVLFPTASGWAIRDLDSTNGTWVNDTRIDEDRALADGDRVRLGPGGPLLVYHAGAYVPAGSTEPATVLTPSGRGHRTEGRRLAWIAAAAAVLALSSGTYLAGRFSTRREWDRERATLEARMDSMLDVARARTARMRAANDSLARSRSESVESLELRVTGLLDALQQSEAEVGSLRSSLQNAGDAKLDDDEVASLRRRLQDVSVALERQQLAASLDFGAIEEATRRGTAQVYVETADGVVTGTAFGVDSSGVVMTNRHVVRPEGGERPSRIGVQFADSRQTWPARVVAVSMESDLALLQIERLVGTIPTVRGFNARADTLGSGAPVAMIGFPLGGRPPEGSDRIVRPLLTAGVISGTRGDLLELQGYGERGASGSPVLDRDGMVVAVLVGGTQAGDARVLLAVRAVEALRLLRR